MGKYENTDILKGLSRDIASSKTPDGVLEFALNMMEDDYEGGTASRHTESGCEQQVNSSYVIGGITYQHVGNIDMNPDKKIMFLTDGAGTEIIAHMIRGRLTVIRQFTGTEVFGFDVKYPIQGVGHVRRGTEEIIYWNDTFNPDRNLNLSRLNLYEDTAGVFQPDLTLFNRNFLVPKTELVAENDGGGLFELGTYRIALYYLDRLNNQTEVFYISNQIQVARGNKTDEDALITGGWNINSNNFANNLGAWNPVSKSFTFSFTNVDPTYDKLVVVATKYTDGYGIPVSSSIVDTLNIAERTEIEWTFDGIDAQDPQVDTSVITASYTRYETSQYMLHIQNRLIRANLTENVYDWAKVQRFTTRNAQVKWIAKDVTYNNSDTSPNYKRTPGVFDNLSMMRDEIGAIGYSLLMTDGQESPVIHVPGREDIGAATPLTVNGTVYTNVYGQTPTRGTRPDIPAGENWDKQVKTVAAGANTTTEVGANQAVHLALGIGDTVERWKVWNTAIRDTAADTEVDCVGSGLMGYHETETQYPLVRDSEGEIIYPHDDVAGVITMHNIRHHRMPNCEVAPIADGEGNTSYDGTYTNTSQEMIYPMGFRVYDLVLPPDIEPFVVGIKWYVGDRTVEKTIFDKGYATPIATFGTPPITDAHEIPRLKGNPSTNGDGGALFISGRVMMDDNRFTLAEYAHTEATMEMEVYTVFQDFDNVDAFTQFSRHQFNPKVIRYIENQNIGVGAVTSNPVEGTGSASFNRAQNMFFDGQQHRVENDTWQQKETYVDFNTSLTRGGTLAVNPSPQVIDTFNYPATFRAYPWYISFKRTKDVYNDLQNIQYLPCTDIFQDKTAGTYSSIGNHCYIHKLYHFSGFLNSTAGGGLVTERYRTGILEFFTESEHNGDMRGFGDAEDQQFYPANGNLNDYLDVIDNTGFHKDNDQIREVLYLYNQDYDVLRHPTPRLGIDNTLAWDDPNRGRFPVRAAWSERSQDEEVTDFNLQFPALNYDDLSLNRGEIRMLAQKPNRLYAMTDYSIFMKPTNAQSWDATSTEVYLKTDRFLDIPETELFDTGSGFGGCQSRFANVNTEFGTVYVNQEAGEVYLLNKQLKPISAEGMNISLQEILPSELKRTFKEVTGDDFPMDDTTLYEEYGIGVRCMYDPRLKRVIITKIDYEFLLPFAGYLPAAGAVATDLYWDNENCTFTLGDGTLVPLNVGTTNWQRKHLTLSYSLKSSQWLSFHSWIPKCGIHDTQNLYTLPMNGVTNWYKHVDHNYLEYYDAGVRSPFIVEWITPNFQRGATSQVNWVTRAGIWSDVHKEYLYQEEQTFSQAYIYNEKHTSGLMNLINQQNDPFGWVGHGPADRYITRYQNVWRLNNIWDYRNLSPLAEPAMTQDWTNPDFNSQWFSGNTGGYIDKVPNANSYDMTKSRFDITQIDNEATRVRLIYNSVQPDTKLSVDLLSLFKQNDLI